MATASAVTNTFSMTGTHITENFADLLDSRVKEIVDQSWSVPFQALVLYDQQNTSRAYEIYSAVTGAGLVPKRRDVDPVPMTQIVQGFDNTLTPVEFKLGIQFSRRLQETDQHRVINRLPSQLMRSARITIEEYAALPFNTAFDATVEWVCADGMNLCDKTRRYEDPSVGTWDNEDTAAALSQASIDAMRLAFRKTKNGRGHKTPVVMQKVVVPNDLESTLNVALDSKQKAGTAQNDVSVLNRYGLERMVWDYLTNATAFFGIGPKDDRHQLVWLWGAQPNVLRYDNGNPDVTSYRLRMVYVTGCNDARNIRGNQGA